MEGEDEKESTEGGERGGEAEAAGSGVGVEVGLEDDGEDGHEGKEHDSGERRNGACGEMDEPGGCDEEAERYQKRGGNGGTGGSAGEGEQCSRQRAQGQREGLAGECRQNGMG